MTHARRCLTSQRAASTNRALSSRTSRTSAPTDNSDVTEWCVLAHLSYSHVPNKMALLFNALCLIILECFEFKKKLLDLSCYSKARFVYITRCLDSSIVSSILIASNSVTYKMQVSEQHDTFVCSHAYRMPLTNQECHAWMLQFIQPIFYFRLLSEYAYI